MSDVPWDFGQKEWEADENGLRPSITVINDPVHGHMEFHPLCVKIMDTPQFQRLRNIKQLGASYLVYPGASHNRFEHCLGVSYLAMKVASTLKLRQPDLGITDEDVLCVAIAGLCHDLGHGPFSHKFEEVVKEAPDGNDKWKHECASVEMFEHMVKANQLDTQFEKYDIKDKQQFILDMIDGERRKAKGDTDKAKGDTDKAKGDTDKAKGDTDKDKEFLYEIVANSRNGIDVDKWDYLARDAMMTGMPNCFDHRRLMKFVRAIKHGKEWVLCTRDKEVANVYEMFKQRHFMHVRVYGHRVTKCIEEMMKDALLLANEEIKYPGSDGKMLSIVECTKDMQAYTLLDDSVLNKISTSPSASEEAKELLRRINKRDLYHCVAETYPMKGPSAVIRGVPDSGRNEGEEKKVATFIRNELGLNNIIGVEKIASTVRFGDPRPVKVTVSEDVRKMILDRDHAKISSPENGSIFIKGISEVCQSSAELKEVADFIMRDVKPDGFSIEQIESAERCGDRPVRVTWTEEKTRDEILQKNHPQISAVDQLQGPSAVIRGVPDSGRNEGEEKKVAAFIRNKLGLNNIIGVEKIASTVRFGDPRPVKVIVSEDVREMNGIILIGIPEVCVGSAELKGKVADFIMHDVKPDGFSIEQIDAAERCGDRPVRVTWTEQKTRDDILQKNDPQISAVHQLQKVNFHGCFVMKCKVGFSSKDVNPVDNMLFYSKKNPTKAKPIPKEEVSLFLPSVYAEDTLRLISRKRGVDCKEDIDKFEEECRQHGVKVKKYV